VTAPPGFEWVRKGPVTVLVRADVRQWLVPLLDAANGQAGIATQPVIGGRGGAFIVHGPEGHAVVVRPYRRGGLPARWLYDTYFGWEARPVRELCVMDALRRRGAPVAEVYAAMVEWLLPGCYRGSLVTRYVSGARSLWAWVSGAPAPPERTAVFGQVGRALRCLHDRGKCHPDLNLNNILVCPGFPAPTILFIDFDRAHGAARWHAFAADLARLRRSAQKLDPRGERVTQADLEDLEAAYRAGDTCA
jgi:tRNA A-37 threonylcarbamoyl transferase component Bud32